MMRAKLIALAEHTTTCAEFGPCSATHLCYLGAGLFSDILDAIGPVRRGSSGRLTEEQRRLIVALYSYGTVTFNDLAYQFRVSHSTIANIVRAAGIFIRRRVRQGLQVYPAAVDVAAHVADCASCAAHEVSERNFCETGAGLLGAARAAAYTTCTRNSLDGIDIADIINAHTKGVMTQTELAARYGVSQGSISRILRASR